MGSGSHKWNCYRWKSSIERPLAAYGNASCLQVSLLPPFNGPCSAAGLYLRRAPAARQPLRRHSPQPTYRLVLSLTVALLGTVGEYEEPSRPMVPEFSAALANA